MKAVTLKIASIKIGRELMNMKKKIINIVIRILRNAISE